MHTIKVPEDVSLDHINPGLKLRFVDFLNQTLMSWKGWRRAGWIETMGSISALARKHAKVGSVFAIEDEEWEKLCTCVRELEIAPLVVTSVQPFMSAILLAPKGGVPSDSAAPRKGRK